MSLSQAYVGTVVIKESMMMMMIMFGHSSRVRKVCIEYRASKLLPERSKREGGIVFTS